MTVRTLLNITTGKFELRSGRRSIFTKVRPADVRKHLNEEVLQIFTKNNVLIIRSDVPDYELDNDVELDQNEEVLPWY